MAFSFTGDAEIMQAVLAIQATCPVPCRFVLNGRSSADDCVTKGEPSKTKEVPPVVPRKCGICHEVVSEGKSFRKRRFGILENCCDAFCLPCIRNYHSTHFRKEPGRRCSETKPEPLACPLCGAKSNYILSSLSWVEEPRQKAWLQFEFLRNTWDIPCEFLRRGFDCNSPGLLHDNVQRENKAVTTSEKV